MLLTVRAEHPDIVQRPVRAKVAVNGRTVLDTTLHTSAPILRVVWTGPAPRAIIEARVDRTWRDPAAPADAPEAGLTLSWRFVSSAPEGLPIVSAPGPR